MMIGKIDVAEQLHQFFFSLLKHREAPDFIRKHRLWHGFWQYGWMTRILIVAAFLVGLKLFSVLIDWWGVADLSNIGSTVSNMGVLIMDFASEGFNYLFLGGMKYVILILMEVLVFHVCRRTVSILMGKDSPSTFHDFLRAQIRMIRVSVRSWIRESVVTLIIGTIFGILKKQTAKICAANKSS